MKAGYEDRCEGWLSREDEDWCEGWLSRLMKIGVKVG